MAVHGQAQPRVSGRGALRARQPHAERTAEELQDPGRRHGAHRVQAALRYVLRSPFP